MKLIFFNHNNNGEVAEAGNVIKDIVSEANFTALQEWQDPFYKDESLSVCIFHGIPDLFSFDDLAKKGNWNKPDGMIVCSISTAPLSKEIKAIDSGNTKHWRVTVTNARAVGLIGVEQSVLRSNWEAFLNALTADLFLKSAIKSEDLTGELGRFLNPDYAEQILAFRLLCEAKLFCGDSPTKEINSVKINAPMTIDHWLAPFDKSKASEIDHVASLMGGQDERSKAKKVLEAVNGNGNLGQSIREFLEVSAESKKA